MWRYWWGNMDTKFKKDPLWNVFWHKNLFEWVSHIPLKVIPLLLSDLLALLWCTHYMSFVCGYRCLIPVGVDGLQLWVSQCQGLWGNPYSSELSSPLSRLLQLIALKEDKSFCDHFCRYTSVLTKTLIYLKPAQNITSYSKPLLIRYLITETPHNRWHYPSWSLWGK